MSSTILGAHHQATPAKDMAVARALGRRRRLKDNLVRWLCIGATAVGLFFLASIMFTLLSRGLDPVLSTPEEFAAYIQRDIAFKARLIKLSGATAE